MFEELIEQNKLPSFRLKQLNQAYYKEFLTDFSNYTTLSKDLRKKLSEEVDLEFLNVKSKLVSSDKDTVKVLFETKTGKLIESVLMMHEDGRNTVCVSCMQGCPVGCTFCATGQMGFGGHLSPDEIVAQVIYFARLLKTDYKSETGISNVVYMGMGEPMLNFDNVWKSYQILTDPDKFGLGKRKVTISTSGFIKGVEKLIENNYKGRLAVSLHASNQQVREKLMGGVAKSNKLSDLMEVLDKFAEMTNKRITYEYILIESETDTEKSAQELIELFRNRLAHFNLIPYNPIPNASFLRPSRNRVVQFEEKLKRAGIPVSIRVTMGDDIKAACGQLATKVK